MFYSEQLLAKNGPLGRIWLASNVERKLTKNHVLTSDLSSSVNTIVNETQAPIALRMSAQLMLGVVRIYGRKARYLLDDSNEALVKIRMTFKNTTNHDLTNQVATTVELNLPESMTIDDLFPPLDFGFGFTQPRPSATPERTLTYDDDWASSLNVQTQSVHDSARSDRHAHIHDDDLGLDLGEDIGLGDTSISIQVGRGGVEAQDDTTALAVYDDDGDLGLDLGEDVPMPDSRRDTSALPQIEDDLAAVQLGEDRERTVERAESVLSEADPTMMEELDRTFAQQEDVEEQVARQAPSRRQRPLEPDINTEIRSSEFKAFAEDTSKILKPLNLLPQDPELMALLNMQRSGDFVTNAMNDTFGHMAPEIQGLLAFDVVRRTGQKRKRDSGIADIHSEDEHSDKSPRLDREIQPEDEQAIIDDEGVEVPEQSPARATSEIAETHEPIDTEHPSLGDVVQGEDEEGIYAADNNFDETTMPLVHPADSGPISDGTKRAVHEFRRIFGDQPTGASPSRKTILLQDIIPEQRTSKADATKMFFETLVLATKDAIKIEQGSDSIGMPIRIRAKRGLWGQWAEDSQTQEVAIET
ncbi:sister chromatid cohesion protein 1 [Elasticomyces elasticus]|nr:sister chromatid cohesion protein 1 [Elasticomyces elasticus]